MEYQGGLVGHSGRDTDTATPSSMMSREEERRTFEQRLVDTHGAAWVKANRTMLDAQWAEMIEAGLV